MRNSLIGNGFHLPSLMCLLLMLISINEAKPVVSRFSTVDCLAAKLQHSLWEPGFLTNFPGMLSAPEVVEVMRLQFDQVQIAQPVWCAVEKNLSQCNLELPQAFAAFQRGRGQSWDHLPPRPLRARDRAEIFAGNSGQRYASDTSKGLDHLLPPGLGKEGHLHEAMRLPSPFRPKPWPPLLAQRQRDIMKQICRAVSPLQQALAKRLCTSARKVASCKNPAFIAVVTALLRWPDLTQAQSFVLGFPIVGDVPFSGVFRSVSEKPEDTENTEKWLQREGCSVVDALLQQGPPKDHDIILQVTQDEIAKGFCSPLMSRTEVDAKFGHGKRRPLERFVIVQPDGKQRVIDNARKTGHNAHTSMLETIHTVSVDFIACCARDVLQAIFPRCRDAVPPSCSWLTLRLGTDDLPDAYRGHPVSVDHLRFSVVSVWVPGRGWQFTILWGLAYGLEAAVVAFNRMPLLGIAACRRTVSSFSAAYFDDELALEFVRNSDISQVGLHLIFSLMGSEPQPAKRFWATPDRCYLGTSVHVGRAAEEGIRVQPKTSSVQKVCAKLDDALESASLSRDEAGKLRGDLQWLFSNCSGASAKFAGPLLQRCQYGDDPILSERDLLVLRTLREVAILAKPRDILCWAGCSPSLLVYTDASFEANQLQLGWVIFAHPPYRPIGGTCQVPQAVLDEWAPRRQQIFPGEALCLLILPLLYPTLLQGHDLLWFIDNQAAVAAAVKASSAEEDVFEIAHMAHLLRAQLSCRSWFEWIHSESNPSDGLSREGLADAWTLAQDWFLESRSFPAAAYRSKIRADLLSVR